MVFSKKNFFYFTHDLKIEFLDKIHLFLYRLIFGEEDYETRSKKRKTRKCKWIIQ